MAAVVSDSAAKEQKFFGSFFQKRTACLAFISSLAALLLAGCNVGPRSGACPLPGEAPMLAVDMFFGRDIAGRAPLSDAEWDQFAASQLTPRFPDGFTVLRGQGQWLNPQSGTIGREASLVVRAVVAPGADVAARVRAVSEAYKAAFHQVAVGVVSAPVCARF